MSVGELIETLNTLDRDSTVVVVAYLDNLGTPTTDITNVIDDAGNSFIHQCKCVTINCRLPYGFDCPECESRRSGN